jgi:hypothetical protein
MGGNELTHASDTYSVIESSVRDTLGSVVWSHKIQEKQADIYDMRFKYMEIAKITAASLTSVGIISLIFSDELWIKIISMLLSFISVFVSAFFKSFDLQLMVNQHKAAAHTLLAIRDDLKLLLMQIRLQGDDIIGIYQKYETTVHRLDQIYAEAPKTTNKAVKKAKKALNITKDNTISDAEVDSFLPVGLRKREEEK